MRILVAAGFAAGSTFASTINTVKMAEGFAMLGHDVTLACRAPFAGVLDQEELKYQYALHNHIRWTQLTPTRKGQMLDPHWDFARQLFPYLLFSRPDFVFSRNYILPWLSSVMGIPTAAESHAHPGTSTRPFNTFVKGTSRRRFKALVTIARILADNFKSIGVPENKIVVLPDAVDLHNFLPPDVLPVSPYGIGPNVVYSGHLYDYKGIPDILGAAKLLPDVIFHLVGGLAEDIQRAKTSIETLRQNNIVLHGHKPRTELPPYLWHADVLLLPPSGKHPSAQWTSPVKLGEYLASGRPLLSTDIPALKAWLTDKQTKFVAPDDPASLAAGIQWLLEHTKEAAAMASSGQELASTLGYSQRASAILDFCGMRFS
ncbi:MAG: glycosyltransferase family 4 protein [Desulfovibrio sp.]|jgi:glycosyltransferase involved in cell wall biosynthesis|nr:glycosyltransferase family 4 protein [Desulfovibrio sp.]